MEKFLPRIWIFVLAFGFGISISAIWRIYTLPAYSPPEPMIETRVEAPRAEMEAPNDTDEPRLIPDTHTCGASGNGQGYHYTDGGWVATKCRQFNSSSAAARELGKRLRDATIEDHSPDVDPAGHPIGEQYLITAPNIVRLRINGSLLCELEASSLKHLRLFEKRP